MNQTRYCKSCDSTLNVEEFYARKSGGYSSYCKICERKQKRKRYHAKTQGSQSYKVRLQPDGRLRCNKCLNIKDTKEFSNNKNYKYGKESYCKDCIAECRLSTATKYQKHRTTDNKQFKGDRKLLRRFYAYPNQIARRNRKNKTGRVLTFTLTIDEFVSITTQPCRYCGCFNEGENYVGIDRIDSSKDYTSSNCAPCCKVCNTMKMQHTLDFFLAHIHKIAAKNPPK